MAPVDLPFLQRYTSDGSTYHYFRRGKVRVRLRGTPGSPEFLAAYQAALGAQPAPKPKPAAPAAGTLQLLVTRYKASPDYLQLARTTQRDYAALLNRLLEHGAGTPQGRAGDRMVAHLTREWIRRRQAERMDQPRTANLLVAVLRRVLNWGMEADMLTTNPALGIRPLRIKPNSHRVWTDAELAAMTSPAAGAIALPVLLGLYTGQRLGDVLRMGWTSCEGRGISLRQGKTDARLTVPIHPELAAALADTKRTATVICTRKPGKPWTRDDFVHRFAEVRAKLGLPPDVHFHGLRHTAASRLAESGASDAEIQALTGHRSRKMVEHYTRGARNTALASAAIARLPRRKSEI